MCGCGCGHVSLQMFLVHIPICCLVDTLERRWAPEYKWLHPVLVQCIFPCNNWHDFINWYKSKHQSKISMQPSNALHRQPISCWLVQVPNCSCASLLWLGWKQLCRVKQELRWVCAGRTLSPRGLPLLLCSEKKSVSLMQHSSLTMGCVRVAPTYVAWNIVLMVEVCIFSGLTVNNVLQYV